ncbi:ATP-binding cassette domain-containing protein [Variovorax sp. J22G21]|uniref:ABC transporter ATP-binding protein n=1 Tax=Variovorax fucosicus TaxID=3053517 RepID=UPI0025754414|nr:MULTISPECIES: oligopeptide/dipeptide ABC transporter ATP-binding protein [unclassified Variovorax]MDM0040362.1 ATP-binding cassette domain-containing protein [Variovorax sp. J22R193]MDM0061735.1 ATP-binding cassette domain-containing protein [Variovorax sp. J22G21]
MSASLLEATRKGSVDASILRAEALEKRFPIPQPWPKPPQQLIAVRDVSLRLREGETLGIVGESGCGKSTLSRMLVGTLPPSSGRLMLDGVDIGAPGDPQRQTHLRHLQMVFQSPYSSLNPRMRIVDIVREPLDIHESGLTRQKRQERALDILQRVGLGEAFAMRYPQQLSGGQQQRVGIARALVRKPRIVVCDEPVSALDVSVQAQVINLLRELQREMGVSYIFVSHDLAVVANIADTLAVMYLGRVVESGLAADILGNPRHPYTQALVDSSAVPDPAFERQRSPRVLKGELPDPMNPPSGCPFRTRCWQAAQECAERLPELVLRPGAPQQVACHFA